MAFTNPVLVKVSDSLYRLTVDSIGSSSDGTVSLGSGLGMVDISDAPEWGEYGSTTLQDAVECWYVEAGPSASSCSPQFYAAALYIVKTGVDHSDFLITITNENAFSTGKLEFWVRFH